MARKQERKKETKKLREKQRYFDISKEMEKYFFLLPVLPACIGPQRDSIYRGCRPRSERGSPVGWLSGRCAVRGAEGVMCHRKLMSAVLI